MTPSRGNLDKKRRAAAHPDRPGVRCSAPPGTYQPVIDHARCEGKRDCIEVCPNDVFEVRRIDDADFTALGRVARMKVRAHRMVTAYAPNADQCHACGLCVVACPEKAIVLSEKAIVLSEKAIVLSEKAIVLREPT